MLLSLALVTLLPALVAAAGLFGGDLFGRRGGATWAGPVAVALGYGAGHTALLGLPPLLPIEASQWLPHLALVAAAIAVVDGVVPKARAWRWPLRTLLLLAATLLLLRPLLAYSWGWTAGAARVVAVVTIAGVVWAAWAAAGQKMAPLPFALLLIGCTTALSAATLLSHSASLAQLAGCLAAALGGSAGATLLLRPALPLGPLATVAVPLLAALATTAHFYADLPLVAVALLAAAPVAAGLATRRPGGAWPGLAAAVALAAGAVTAAAFGG